MRKDKHLLILKTALSETVAVVEELLEAEANERRSRRSSCGEKLFDAMDRAFHARMAVKCAIADDRKILKDNP